MIMQASLKVFVVFPGKTYIILIKKTWTRTGRKFVMAEQAIKLNGLYNL